MELASDLIGGKYQLTRRIGQGGMGAVYEATHLVTGRRVAIKVLLDVNWENDREIEARFEREARVTAGITSQHIVQVLDTGRDDENKVPYIVIEFLDGDDLNKTLKRLGELPPKLVLRIIAQACLGLAKAHEAGIVHRDIKPANLFLAAGDAGHITVKILDFGIAKLKLENSEEGEGADLTRTGSMLGSPHYMSPEQARGLKTIDHRADIWSLGIVMYKALCGRTPHTQSEGGLGELLMNICTQAPPPVQDFAPWIDESVAAIVHRALRMKPDERFQSALEMFDAIRVHLPEGYELSSELLVGVSDNSRMLIAPRLTSIPEAIASGRGPGVVGEMAMMPASALSQSHAGVYAPAPRARSGAGFAAMAAGALVLSGLAVAGAWKILSAAASAQRAPVAPALVVSAAAAPEAAVRTVQVFVSPPDASVEVDGKPQTAIDGIVKLTGALGSLHDIKLIAEGRTHGAEVAVTEQGALPPRVTMPAAPAAPSALPSAVVGRFPGRPGPGPKPNEKSPPGGKPAPPKSPAGVSTVFD